jgi:dTDP-glucose 4,6-dehydratase
VVRVTGSSSEIVFAALPVDDPQVRQPDITRARQLLGWGPEIELEEGLRRTIASLGHEAAVGSA